MVTKSLALVCVALCTTVQAVDVIINAPQGRCKETPIQTVAPAWASCLNDATSPGIPSDNTWVVHFGSKKDGSAPFIWYSNSYAYTGQADACGGVAGDGSGGNTIIQGADLNFYVYTPTCCPVTGASCDSTGPSPCELFKRQNDVTVAQAGGVPEYKSGKWTSTTPCGCPNCAPRVEVTNGGSTPLATLFQGDSPYKTSYCGDGYIAVSEIQAGKNAITLNFKSKIKLFDGSDGCDFCGSSAITKNFGAPFFEDVISTFSITGVDTPFSDTGQSIACLTGDPVSIGGLPNVGVVGALPEQTSCGYVPVGNPTFCENCATKCPGRRCGRRCKRRCGF